MANSNEHKQPSGSAGHPLDRYSPAPQSSEGGGGNDSPYYKSAAPSIALPKGGGALKGIDEKFSVNAVNGTAGLSVPLPLTPGRGGFTPALSLSYNSGSGNSPFGLGWNMGLPSIRRKTDKCLPLYDDLADSDTFLLAGAEDLVPKLKIVNGAWETDTKMVDGATLVRSYIPRIEGLFARIEHISKLGVKGSWWRVTTKDNITTYYGLTPAGRIADPENGERIFEWLPQLVYDARGNVQEYRYAQEDAVNVPDALHELNRKNGNAPFTNTYLKSVHYCNKTPQLVDAANVYVPGFPAAPEYLMEVVLDYGDHGEDNYTPAPDKAWPCRADAFSDFHAGFEIRTYRRCRRVLMFHRFNELNSDGSDTPVLVRSLAFTYSQDGAGAALAEADLLLSAMQTGYLYDGAGTYTSKSLPPMTMDYAPLQWDTALHHVAPGDLENAPQGLSGAYQWTDLWGEGLPGILTEQAGGWFYKSNLGDAHFTPAMPVAEKPSFAGLGKNMQWADLDADGRRQLVSYDLAMAGYFELDDEQHWQGFRSFKERVNVDWHSPYTRMLDLDGDGRPDLLLTEEAVWTWYANKGTEGFTTGGQAGQGWNEELGPRLLLNDAIQRIFLADMNGDGLTDLVRITNGEVCYWPNRGRGAFGARVAMSNAPHFAAPDLYNPLFLHLADISGTGAPDLLYRNADGSITAWINCAGNGFGGAIDLGQLPHAAPDTVISMIDLLGSGTSCIVWSSPLPADATAPMRYMDLMGGIKPYLMRGYENGMGKRVDVTYRSSAKYYLDDNQDGTPWATRLPFPVQCIDNITTTDTVSETMYTQTYRYHHGYYDHEEREFRGFGRVDVIDIDTATVHDANDSSLFPIPASLDQSPVLTKTWYHTGAWIREGSLLAAFAKEYNHFAGWDALPEQAAFPAGLGAVEQREAHRALKGSALRQEVYALDASPDEDKPYTVTVSAYEVLAVQPKGENRFASFRVQGQQSLAWSTERVPEDARLAQRLTLETDEWGNVTKSAQVVYPRRNADADHMDLQTLYDLVDGPVYGDDAALKAALAGYFDPESLAGGAVREGLAALGILAGNAVDGYSLMPAAPVGEVQLYVPFPVAAAQAQMHITYSAQAFTGDVIGRAAYRLRLPYEAQGYELSGYAMPTGLWTPAALLAAVSAAAEIDYAVAPAAGALQKRLLSHTRALYLGDDTETVLDPGMHESLGLPYQHYSLAFTEKIRKDVYDTRVSDSMLLEGGYVDIDRNGNWWVPSGTAQYSAAPATDFYSPQAFTDPWGNVTTVNYWGDYCLLPESTEDALGNTSSVLAYNWATLQPLQLRDANDNISAMLYDALGMPVAMALKGKDDGTEGDTLDDLVADGAGDLAAQAAFWADPKANAADLIKGATFRCLYDLNSTPTAVAMIGREQHFLPSKEMGELLIRITYTDGFGRVIMHKAQATDDPLTNASRWIGSGRTVYNNKGKPVMQYEPYFSATHHCDTAEQAANEGVSPRIYYDALGRAHRTELPDGTYSKVEWTGWRQQSYDPNDTVADSDWYYQRTDPSGGYYGIAEEADAAAKALRHAGTPVTVHLDTLGRPFYSIQHNTYPDPAGSSNPWLSEYLHTYETLDIAGDRMAVHDARGLTPLRYKYNPLKTAGYQHSIDGGEGRMLGDVAGQPLYHWDAEDRCFRSVYDALRRLVESRVSVGGGAESILSKTTYGEGATDDKLHNLRGQVLHSYDGAGKHSVDGYDFKGAPVTSYLQLLTDGTMADADWNTLTGGDLSGEVFTTTVLSDALGRPVRATDAGGNVTEHTYGKDGALKTVVVNGKTYVQDIRHNAKGQREAIWYGNGTKTGYTYDEQSQRLRRLLTVNVNGASAHYNEVAQDLNYFYDAVGNITTIRDDAQQAIFYNNSLVSPDQSYTYDSLYRLVKAEGREGIGLAAASSPDSWADSDKVDSTVLPSNTTAVQRYVQQYRYDKAGNMLELKHMAATGSYTRRFSVSGNSNRLKNSGMYVGSNPPTAYRYDHDLRGNITAMPHLVEMDYDCMSQMTYIRAGTTDVCYQYSDGQRLRKYLIKSGGVTEERLYLGSYEVYRERDSSGVITLERTTVHVGDDTGRVAMLEVRTHGSDGSPASLKRFIYSNHLQSAALELDDTANIISYEEYHPYGTTSYQAMDAGINAVAKRYRYTGKERDEESGLNYHGARYYAPWICRWCAVDPLESKYAGMSPYNYCFNNPVMHTDSNGMEPSDGKKEGSWYRDKKGYHFMANITNWFEYHDKGFDQKGRTYVGQEPSDSKGNTVIQYDRYGGVHPKKAHTTYSKGTEVTHKGPDPNEVSRTPLPPPKHTSFPISAPSGGSETAPSENHGIGLSMSKVADVVTDFVPIVSGAKDIYRGFRDGNYLQAGLGILSVGFDIFTLGGGSLIKGGIKSGFKLLGKLFVKDEVEHLAGAGAIGLLKQGSEKAATTVGEFSITELGWKGYPKNIPRPKGPFRLIEGEEYAMARTQANRANRGLRERFDLVGKGIEIHEVIPVKFGGSATNINNKIILDATFHRTQVTPFWNNLQRSINAF